MADSAPNPIPVLRQLLVGRAADSESDHALLRRFADGREESAFAVIVSRHGPMVFDVCRGVLRREADAEDAYQATFLVLATKAGAIRKSDSLAAWLHGVAYRVSLRARASATRRRAAESEAPAPTSGPDPVTWAEAQAVVHEELARLPDRYRAPLVHCYLRGQTQDEAAPLLGLSKGTLKRRLERGRARLRERLIRRGLGPTAAVLLAAWPASARMRTELLDQTVKNATQFLATAAGVPGSVVTLATGVLHAMRIARLKAITAALALSLSLLLGVGAAAGRLLADNPPKAEQPKPKEEPLAKKEEPPAAKGVAKVELQKLMGGFGGPRYTPKKTIEDKEKIGQLVALFPGIGADRKFVGSGRSGFNTYRITVVPEKGDPISIGVLVSEDLNVWMWSQGKNGSDGDLKLAKPKETATFLDALLGEEEKPPLAAKGVTKVELQRVNGGGGRPPRLSAKTPVDDKEKIGQLLAHFPGIGAEQKYVPPARNGSSTYAITVHPEKGEPITIFALSGNRGVWGWKQGGNGSDGDLKLDRPRELTKLLEALFAEEKK